ncbi:MAG: nucleoside transporter C-terminal domain-containing protein [Bacteroidia bacterium]|nr:nucleoside transporter C-terminal domain-containing protein [Bacteroidia bacterium]
MSKRIGLLGALLIGVLYLPAQPAGADRWAGTWAQPGDTLTLNAEGGFDRIQSSGTRTSGAWSAQGDTLRLAPDPDGAPPQQLILTSTGAAQSLEPGGLMRAAASPAVPSAAPAPPSMLSSPMGWMDLLRGALGIAVMLGCCWLLSANRKAIDWRLVATGMGLQVLFAILVLKVPFVKDFFAWIAGGFVRILDFSEAGAAFIFGSLVTKTDSFGYIFAFQILPTIVFFSALMSILYYLGILQRVVYFVALGMSKTMRLSGAESLAAAGNIFLGQTEAPLLIKPYVERMTRSEILCLMTGGMATIAGGVFAAYVGYLGGSDPVQQQIFATHLLCASIMSAPAAIVAAKMLMPETEEISQDLSVPREKLGSNVLEAISIGTGDGLRLAVNVGVMLLVFTALIDMANYILINGLGSWTGLNELVASSTGGRYQQLNLQYLFGLIFAPFAWLLGVPAQDSMIVGQLLGEKTILNEFVAYTTMGNMQAAGSVAHFKSIIIATYALCGFANFASIGIQIGGIGALAPGKRTLLSELGIKALIGGTVASFLTAAIAGAMIGA